MRSSGSAYGRTCPERPCSGGRHCRKVGHANPQAPTSWRGPMGPACLRAPVYLTPFGSRRSPAWPTSSNNLPPSRSGATRQAVPRSPAPALPGRRWPYSPRLKKKLANKWARN